MEENEYRELRVRSNQFTRELLNKIGNTDPHLIGTELLQNFSRDDAAAIYLTLNGLKPCGRLESNDIERAEQMADFVRRHGCSTRILTADEITSMWEIPVKMNITLYWKNNTSEEKIVEQFKENEGALYRFPDCCVEEYGKQELNGMKFSHKLKERYLESGIGGIIHLAGIQHVPCRIDCENTRNLGYAEKLKEVPVLYGAALDRLLSTVVSFYWKEKQ
jgi:hypothetical protein